MRRATNGFTLRSDEPVSGFSSASPWPGLELEWNRKLYPSAGPRSSALMFGLPPGNGEHMNQPRGPLTSLKEEPLGARAWMQPIDQTKYVIYICAAGGGDSPEKVDKDIYL